MSDTKSCNHVYDYQGCGDWVCTLCGNGTDNAGHDDFIIEWQSRRIKELTELYAKVRRLESRGIEDMHHRIAELEAELTELKLPIIRDHNITEIIPADRPDWATEAMKEGRFFTVALDRVQELETFIEAEGACYQKELDDKIKHLEKTNSELLRRNLMLSLHSRSNREWAT